MAGKRKINSEVVSESKKSKNEEWDIYLPFFNQGVHRKRCVFWASFLYCPKRNSGQMTIRRIPLYIFMHSLLYTSSSRTKEKLTEAEERTPEKDLSKDTSDMSKLKILSFNVAGLHACVKKDFCANMKKLNPDIICLQGLFVNSLFPSKYLIFRN